jgi:hypothetical protein
MQKISKICVTFTYTIETKVKCILTSYKDNN